MPGALFEARLLFRPGTFRIAFAPAETALFLSFSYVCPEPVLVK